MCQEKISRLLKKYGDTFDTVFFRMVENLVGPGKTDTQILALVKTKQTDRKISSIRHQGHVLSDKIIERWFDYLGASSDEINDIKLLAEYFRNINKAKSLKIDGNPMFEKPIFIESAVPIKKTPKPESNICVAIQETSEPDVRVLDEQEQKDCCKNDVRPLIVNWDKLAELRHQLNDPEFERFLEFVYYVADAEYDAFADKVGLSWDWFKQNVDVGMMKLFGDAKALLVFLKDRLGFSGEVATWIIIGTRPAKPIRILSEEFRAAISPHSNSLALKTNGNSL